MTIYRDNNSVTISHGPICDKEGTVQRHVFIGLLSTHFCLSDGTRQVREMPGKPHDDLTIADCRKLLNEMEKMNIQRCNSK